MKASKSENKDYLNMAIIAYTDDIHFLNKCPKYTVV